MFLKFPSHSVVIGCEDNLELLIYYLRRKVTSGTENFRVYGACPSKMGAAVREWSRLGRVGI